MITNLADVPGVGETVLADTVGIPGDAPAAPWRCRCDAVVWTAAANAAAADALPPAVAVLGRPVGVLGGFVRYRETPVGAYDEVFGAVLLATRRGVRGTVPFMAVDSRASVAGGRLNWSLPKTLAEFGGAPAGGMRAVGDGWSVRCTASAARRGLPGVVGGRVAQSWPDGDVRHARLRMRARMHPALIRVSTESDGTLPRWLRGGRHLGAVYRDVTFDLGPAESPCSVDTARKAYV